MTKLADAIETAERRFASEWDHDRRITVSLSRLSRIRNLDLHRDEGGLYVRTGKRGQCKRYLSEADDAMIVSTSSLSLVHFYGL